VRSLFAFFRRVPRTVVGFSALHALAGIFFLLVLFAMRCVDDPCPPGLACYDGCSARHDPWLEGHAPYLLVPVLLLIGSSIWLLRASRGARIVLPVSIVTSIYAFYLSAIYMAVARGSVPDAPPSWVVSWKEGLGYVPLAGWLFPVAWGALATWFLFGSRTRAFFENTPLRNPGAQP
jgi:hypothetical protein